jgi:two-component sensor histidine kinase
MLVVDDARHDRGIIPVIREHIDVGSVAYLPLFRGAGGGGGGDDGHDADGHVNGINDDENAGPVTAPPSRHLMGLLILARRKFGPFSAEQLELAQVFASRAASAIENAQLLEQTRRDAQTKAMLLREVNHRVKNNLAGIVALLEADRPDVPADARRWLDRLTGRIRAIAAAHTLFVGGQGEVTLARLVEQTLSSVSVADSPGVRVRVDFGPDASDDDKEGHEQGHEQGHGGAVGAGSIRLRTEQAVSLAMVLHELCYNGITHGLRGSGTLTIRARRAAPRRLVIDVADEGPGTTDTSGGGAGQVRCRRSTDATYATGMGLALVDGLVCGELGGRFAVRPADGGGTVATVEFPVTAGDAAAAAGAGVHVQDRDGGEKVTRTT